ncbi:hypothetical protein CJD36_014835 [Flavipsychrobacter stenotrophus]|uniref:Type II toxin-antitoxin system RelE/ParE family toxin n=1 Tax=Flavipsychrobacter stenotrophus TaxID=2077091 RepID=A0A2S7SSR6_9BACT|nr:type II toxin-antitoxin system RelE/ParE family toxin [Flavipsychrobacter stenotrophus]PQJ09972.1 hypothetical protein CJD36_014835 [Flavipsychrobacter stenotrophus]
MQEYKPILTPRAISEIQKAVDYYNGQLHGLGKRFYQDFKKQVKAISTNPFSRAVRYNDIRFAVLDKFPYAAHYTIIDKNIVILAVLSMYQDPQSNWVNY